MPAAIADPERPGVQGEAVAKISTSPRVATQRAFNAQIQNSPLAMAQKKVMENVASHSAETAQLEADEELKGGLAQLEADEELKGGPAQLETDEELKGSAAQLVSETRSNDTGLPDNLKAGIESLSGISMDAVKVHYNSSQPAQLNALAYAQGTDIHVAPGQEQHLPHEAWHVVQQAQGRVQPTVQMQDGVSVNDDAGLEHEADVMGNKALATATHPAQQMRRSPSSEKPETYQLVKASDLFKIGKRWFSKIWVKSEYESKKNFYDAVKEMTGFSTGTVFVPYDLYVRGKGPSKYIDIVKWFGKTEAQQFLDFLNDEIDFEDLNENLRKIAIIVCVSETGRGYDVHEMMRFLKKIVSDQAEWSQIKQEYYPSLTYGEDANKSFQPTEEEMNESDECYEEKMNESGEYYDEISQEEIEDLDEDNQDEESFEFGETRSRGNFRK